MAVVLNVREVEALASTLYVGTISVASSIDLSITDEYRFFERAFVIRRLAGIRHRSVQLVLTIQRRPSLKTAIERRYPPPIHPYTDGSRNGSGGWSAVLPASTATTDPNCRP